LGCKPMLPGTMARCRTDITVIGRAGPPRRRLAPDAWLASPAGEPVCVPGSVVSAELDPRVLNRARGGGLLPALHWPGNRVPTHRRCRVVLRKAPPASWRTGLGASSESSGPGVRWHSSSPPTSNWPAQLESPAMPIKARLRGDSFDLGILAGLFPTTGDPIVSTGRGVLPHVGVAWRQPDCRRPSDVRPGFLLAP
jgi:hypothetical protein